MNIEAFWTTIDDARQSVEKLTDVPARLIDVVSKMDEKEIVGFGSHFVDCLHVSYDAKLWLAAVVIMDGCGDDTFSDFRCWLIAQGREVFKAALADPDSMANLERKRFDGDDGYPVLFYIGSVANKAFSIKIAGKEGDFDAGNRFEMLCHFPKYPLLKNEELLNASDNEAKAMFPRLAAKFPKGIRNELWEKQRGQYINPFPPI